MRTTRPASLRKVGGDLAKMALDAGLVTQLEGRYRTEERLAEITGEDEDANSYQGVDHLAYLANVNSAQGAAEASRSTRSPSSRPRARSCRASRRRA